MSLDYFLILKMDGAFPGAPELDTVTLTEPEYDELWDRFIKPKAIAEGWVGQ